MKIADFEIINDKKVFKAIIDAPKIGEEYFTIANSTRILPTTLPNNNQYLVLENEEWVLFEKELNDIFYKKDNCELVNTIFQKDIDLYTKIPPLKSFNGTIQQFNNELEVWEYVEKGSELLELEFQEKLKILTDTKINEIRTNYQQAQQVLLKNGKAILIKIMGADYSDLQREFNKSSWRKDKLATIIFKNLLDQKKYKIVIPRSFGKHLLAKIQEISQENHLKKEVALEKIEKNELTFDELFALKVDFIFNSEINIDTEACNYINDDYYKTKYPEDIDFVINCNNHFFTEINAE